MEHAIASLYDNVFTETLPNGMRIYLKPIAGSPVVTVMTAYGVGSADDDPQQTGLAHYLEHLLFKGTDKLMPGDIDRLTQRAGGTTNAYTAADYTLYYFDLAAHKWDTALTIEADRMRNTRIDERHEFEMEKGSVVAELRMNEDEPWDAEMRTLLPVLFGDGPYGHPVLGRATHVRAARADEIKDFYDRWYHPNNASLIMVGGFDVDEALNKIRRHFGPIPPVKLPARREAVAEEREGPVRVIMTSKFAQPRLTVAYNGVKLGEREDFTLSVIAQILAGGKTGRLDCRLLEMDAASDVHGDHFAGRYPGRISFDIELSSSQKIEQAEKVVLEELERLATVSVTPAELSRACRQLSASRIFAHESARGLAEAIAVGAITGQPDYLKSYLDNLSTVTAADVKRVAKRVLDRRKRVTVWSLPFGEAAQRKRLDLLKNTSAVCDATLSVVRGRESPVASQPHRLPGHHLDISQAQRHVLPNGLTLLLLENHRLPIVVATADVANTQLIEPAEHAGVAELTGRLLSQGTEGVTGGSIALQIEEVGGELLTHASCGHVKVLSGDRALGLRLLLDCMSKPTFERETFERTKEKLLFEIGDTADGATARAEDIFKQLAYGSHPFARPAIGMSETVRRLTPEQCLAYHQRAFAPSNIVLTVVGDFDSAQVLAEVSQLTSGWQRRDVKLVLPAEPPLRESRIERYIAMPESSQVQVLIGHVGIRRNNPDYYKLLVLDHVLGTGSGFTDRLSASLRDRQGLTYSVNGNITGRASTEPGLFLCSIGTDANNFAHVRDEIIKEINRIRDEVPTHDEVADAKTYLLGSFPFNLSTADGVATQLLQIERYALGNNYVEDFRKQLLAVTPAEVQAVAKKYLHPDKLIIVAVGPIDASGKPTK